jgi:hypothetical protein
MNHCSFHREEMCMERLAVLRVKVVQGGPESCVCACVRVCLCMCVGMCVCVFMCVCLCVCLFV